MLCQVSSNRSPLTLPLYSLPWFPFLTHEDHRSLPQGDGSYEKSSFSDPHYNEDSKKKMKGNKIWKNRYIWPSHHQANIWKYFDVNLCLAFLVFITWFCRFTFPLLSLHSSVFCFFHMHLFALITLYFQSSKQISIYNKGCSYILKTKRWNINYTY